MIRRILPALVLILLALTAVPLPAHAYDAFPKIDCTDASKDKQSTVCATGPADPISGTDGILLKATDIVAYLAGAFALIMILIAALRYVTSGSDLSTQSRTDTDIETAKHTITNALIGLAVIVLARTLITYLIVQWAKTT